MCSSLACPMKHVGAANLTDMISRWHLPLVIPRTTKAEFLRYPCYCLKTGNFTRDRNAEHPPLVPVFTPA